MGFERNTLSDQEYLERLNALMPILDSRHHGKKEIEEMYFLYNDRLTPRENISSCGSCIRRVYERISHYHKQLNSL